MDLQASLMKIVFTVSNVVALARRFESSPGQAMRELATHIKTGVEGLLEEVMAAEIALFLGQPVEVEASNKRNGYTTRSYAIKGVGAVRVRVPRDRQGRFESRVVPPSRRYDEAIEKDIALLNLAGLSTRMIAHISGRVLGMPMSRQEVSNSMHAIVPMAKAFLERPLAGRRFVYLYVDGTFFRVRRTTVDVEPTLVVLGVDEDGRKSVLSMVQGDKDARGAWEVVFADLKARGFDASSVQLGIMDGLPGLATAFVEAFPNARVARCWVHKARNVYMHVPRRYQAAFKAPWDAIQYAESRPAAQEAFDALKLRWGKVCGDAVRCLERDLEALLVHYEFPRAHWEALRTTNAIERVNKEFKRRSKSMEVVSPDGLKALLAFTALRLEYGWATAPLNSVKYDNLRLGRKKQQPSLDDVTTKLFN